ncbi:hypothetical protein BOTBODRAFT_172339 [Botryobasidium botryosum FD-172 SS1]|uniref:Uncharacterized protein n=1 Tax=Botryobasidium botryosum (strain FD-172 SS1) TaxID=930990 RepID=A0A067MNE9_BOTB1|nr:hypothetical protein BOTBODRAFT_172339 [Botryobasidium botryosum FD-172 SS1]
MSSASSSSSSSSSFIPNPTPTKNNVPFDIQLKSPRFLTAFETASVAERLDFISEGFRRYGVTKASYMEKAVRRNIIDFRKRLHLPTIPSTCAFEALFEINEETARDFITHSTSIFAIAFGGKTRPSPSRKDLPYRFPTPTQQTTSTKPTIPITTPATPANSITTPVAPRSPSPKRTEPLPAPTPIRPINPLHLSATSRSPPPPKPSSPKSPNLSPPKPSSPASLLSSLPPSSPPSSLPSSRSPSPTPSTESSSSSASTVIIDGFVPAQAPIPSFAQVASKPAHPIRITQRRLKESSEMETIRVSFNNHPLAHRPLPRAPPPTPTSESARKEAFKNCNKSVNKSLAQIKEAIRSNRAAAEKLKSASVAAKPSPPTESPPPPPQFPNPSNVQGFFSPPTGTKGYAPLLIPFSALALLFTSLDKEA